MDYDAWLSAPYDRQTDGEREAWCEQCEKQTTHAWYWDGYAHTGCQVCEDCGLETELEPEEPDDPRI